MLQLKQNKRPKASAGTELTEVRASIAVLSEVLRQLAERIELLEAGEVLRRFKPATV
jgi:hypothetical protein